MRTSRRIPSRLIRVVNFITGRRWNIVQRWQPFDGHTATSVFEAAGKTRRRRLATPWFQT